MDNNYESYTRKVKSWLRLCGTDTSNKNNINIIVVFVNLIILIFFMYGSLNANPGLKVDTEPVFITIVFIYTVLFYLILLNNCAKIHNLLSMIKELMKFNEDKFSLRKTNIQKRELKLSLILCQTYHISSQIAISSKFISCVLQKQQLFNFDVKFLIPQQLMDMDVVYYVILVLQVIAFQICAFLHGTGLFLFMGMCNILAGQIEILTTSYKTMQETALTKLQENHKSIKYNMKLIVNENIKHHQMLLKFFADFNSVFGWLILELFVSWQLLICFIVFRTFRSIKTEDSSITENIALLMTTFIQPILYMWCGDKVLTKSRELRNSVYTAHWYNQDKSFKNTLSIILECTKRPMVVRSIKLVSANRITFRQILTSAYSYYNVLQALCGKQ